uniref:Uncharacterized protein n=1 Tax=Anguilla anguilla TaxID=7936 RepID=A0A0E9VWH9_ANGAN
MRATTTANYITHIYLIRIYLLKCIIS